MKQCSKCKEFKPLSAFARKARAKDGLNYHCRDCTAAYCRANLDAYARRMREWVKRNPDKYAAHAIKSRRKVRGQVNEPTRPKPDACECCGEIPSKMIEDHDHTTGLFRGWLCHHCNTGLGLFKDSSERLQQAIQYLSNGDILNGIKR